MEVKIGRKEALRVAYARATGPYDQSAKMAWETLCSWAAPKGLFTPQSKFLGIGHDCPDTTPPEKIRYDACVTVGPQVEAEDGIGVTEIPGGEYASVVHKGPYQELPAVYAGLYGEWLAKSGRKAAMRPGYEVYLNDPRTTKPEDLLTEINMPLE